MTRIGGRDVRYASAADGLRIAFGVVGDGPPLLAVGEWWGHVERDWDLPPLARFWNRLSSFGQLILFDRRGTSLSDPLPQGTPPALEDCVTDIVAVLDATATKSATVFVAGSATPLGLLLATTRPDRVTRLIIYNGFARFLTAPDQAFGIPHELVTELKMAMLDDWGSEMPFRFAAPAVDWKPEVMGAAIANMRHTASPATAETLLPLLYENDLRPLLPLNTVPTLVVHSAANALIPVEHGRYLAASIPDARYVELAGRDALFWGEDADALAAEIHAFIEAGNGTADHDRRLATVVSTAVVGMTSDQADGYDRRTHELVREFRGESVRTTGDGFFATFDGPARAIRFALVAREAAQTLGMSVRTGVHTDEVEAHGVYVGGIALEIAARLQALASADEILVSSTVCDLVAGSGIEFTDREGRHLGERWGAWSVCAAAAR
jgi:pimeloyl-ACP methyl ester carboxylesterase